MSRALGASHSVTGSGNALIISALRRRSAFLSRRTSGRSRGKAGSPTRKWKPSARPVGLSANIRRLPKARSTNIVQFSSTNGRSGITFKYPISFEDKGVINLAKCRGRYGYIPSAVIPGAKGLQWCPVQTVAEVFAWSTAELFNDKFSVILDQDVRTDMDSQRWIAMCDLILPAGDPAAEENGDEARKN